MSRFTKRKHLYCFASLRKITQRCGTAGNIRKQKTETISRTLHPRQCTQMVTGKPSLQFNVTLRHTEQVGRLLFAKLESLLKKDNCDLVASSAPINHLANAEKQSCQTK